ncbi:MAG: cation-translocating P-type ATPase [Algoriphagus sp.]|uniref:cation-translocating P-type ATPase n=1 Tax=Algoriphagus sp. TaxID=1872435 RepID=UPI00272FB74A|nr:cation-translocating P-type ATPase [Algoriphagus sp.]MDP2042816.1 cation-translocating P-type ATPase [Algoriphagus sp.]MDP3474248.1 cation-translocating P-type ATPase [Algoriphagus sp.]
MNFYQNSIDELFSQLKSQKEGLTHSEAAKRIQEIGPNILLEKKKKPAWVLFLAQFKDFMILILAAAAVISGIVGDLTDTIIILLIILLNALLGFTQEYRAEKTMESLKKLTETQTKVIRDAQTIVVPSQELVPGDVVVLEAGNMTPADIRLIETFSLKVDESSLTGESVAIDKIADPLEKEGLAPGDQLNMVFKGTLITNGRASGLVVATGMSTEIGKIAGLLQENAPITPLQQRMQRFGKVISYLILGICALLFASGVARGEDIFQVLLLSVSLAVAAIPEALPALITIALSLGAGRLAKKKALIRKLPAVESLGSVTYICTDKTGTLTQNKMSVISLEADHRKSFSPKFSNLQLAMGLSHDVHLDKKGKPEGEATELALVERLLKEISKEQYLLLEQEFPRIGELPFDSTRKRMSTLHQFGDQVLILCKGASESISGILKDGALAKELTLSSEVWAEKGERVLAFAGKLVPNLPPESEWSKLENELDFFGKVGMIDPPREEVKVSIKECKSAGIKPVMITGDHPATAKAIAAKVGIWKTGDLVLTGAELTKLSDEDFAKKVEQISVYARVAPEQKLRIVQALQLKGHYVAMTGDGVNDAPSLKAANIGVAMGIAGTDVSKEAAHMILLDDNFATIVGAVKEGRRIFENIRKFIKYILTCNSAEIWVIGLAPFLGFPNPLLPIHILWINLVTDGLPALALAGEKSEKDQMKRPPRPPKQSLFAEGVGYHIVWVGMLMAGVTLFTQYWAIQNGWHWQTMVFSVLAFSQLGHVMAIRSDRTFLFRQGLLSNLPLLLAVGGTMLLQLGVIYVPFMNDIFHTEALNLKELAFAGGMALIVFHAVELEKWIRSKIK